MNHRARPLLALALAVASAAAPAEVSAAVAAPTRAGPPGPPAAGQPVGVAIGPTRGLGGHPFTGTEARLDVEWLPTRGAGPTLSFVATLGLVAAKGTARQLTAGVGDLPIVPWTASAARFVGALRLATGVGHRLRLYADAGLGLAFTRSDQSGTYQQCNLNGCATLIYRPVGNGTAVDLHLAAGAAVPLTPRLDVTFEAAGLDLTFGHGLAPSWSASLGVAFRP